MKTFSYPQLFIALFALCVGNCLAQDANVIPFQGQLANQAGQVVSPTNSVTLVFRIYTAPVGGIALWEESQPNISVNAGRFSVLLGSRTMLPAASFSNTTLYLGITVDDGDPQTADVEMRPRQALVPVLSARYAQNADKLRGYDWSVLFGTNNPVDGKIQGAQIAPSSITAKQIAPNTITSTQIVQSTITGIQIQDASIPASKLAADVYQLLLPRGTIVMWSGSIATIPSSWALCDGSNGTPDLRDRFVVGARQDQDGVPMTKIKGTLMKTGGLPEVTLTVEQIPPHSHSYNETPWTGGRYDGHSSPLMTDQRAATTGLTGGGQAHENCPPFYALAFIMKQ